MNHFRNVVMIRVKRIVLFTLSSVLAGFGFSTFAAAQSVIGSTTLSVDANSNSVTATCETDLDGSAQGNYQALVRCTVNDSSGNLVASGNGSDVGVDDGVALVTLSFTGVSGMTYTAIGAHSAIAVLNDDNYGPPNYTTYYDPYDFSSFQESYQTFPDYYEWYNTGPAEELRVSTIRIGATTDTKTLQACPTSIAIDQTWSQPLQNDYPQFSTGVGILARMIVGPQASNFTSVVLYETVTPAGNSCPASIRAATNFPTIGYNSSFIVGQTANWEGMNYPSVRNTFYDAHSFKYTSSVLDGTGNTSCQSQATQVYTCNGNPVATFSLTANFYSGVISAQPVTFVNVSKQ